MKQTWTRYFLSLLPSAMYDEYAHTRFFFWGGGATCARPINGNK